MPQHIIFVTTLLCLEREHLEFVTVREMDVLLCDTFAALVWIINEVSIT
jgi:hypothetical protein